MAAIPVKETDGGTLWQRDDGTMFFVPRFSGLAPELAPPDQPGLPPDAGAGQGLQPEPAPSPGPPAAPPPPADASLGPPPPADASLGPPAPPPGAPPPPPPADVYGPPNPSTEAPPSPTPGALPEVGDPADLLVQGRQRQMQGLSDEAKARSAGTQLVADRTASVVDETKARLAEEERARAEAKKSSDDEAASILTEAKKLGATRIDPFQAITGSSSTAGTIGKIFASAIGLLAGGYLEAKTGRNPFRDMAFNIIDRSIAAQREDLATRRETLDARQSLLAQNVKRFGDDQAATSATRATYYQIGIQKLETEKAKYDDEATRAKFDGAIGALQGDLGKELEAFSKERFDRNLASRREGLAEMGAMAKISKGGGAGTGLPGGKMSPEEKAERLRRPWRIYGVDVEEGGQAAAFPGSPKQLPFVEAKSTPDAEKFTVAQEAGAGAVAILRDIVDTRRKYPAKQWDNFIAQTEGAAMINQKTQLLAGALGPILNTGVLNKEEYERIRDNLVGDPTKFFRGANETTWKDLIKTIEQRVSQKFTAATGLAGGLRYDRVSGHWRRGIDTDKAEADRRIVPDAVSELELGIEQTEDPGKRAKLLKRYATQVGDDAKDVRDAAVTFLQPRLGKAAAAMKKGDKNAALDVAQYGEALREIHTAERRRIARLKDFDLYYGDLGTYKALAEKEGLTLREARDKYLDTQAPPEPVEAPPAAGLPALEQPPDLSGTDLQRFGPRTR